MNGQWQPIATAPKGKALLCWWGNCHPPLGDMHYDVAFFRESSARWVDLETDEEFFTPPTHWMALPEPPP